MNRLASLLFLAGIVLLATWVWAPAAPQSTAAARRALETGDPVQDQALLSVTAEVDRLRHRLAVVPNYPAPERDPFRFGSRREIAAPRPAVPQPAVVAPQVPPTIPRLIGIMASTVDGVVKRRVALGIGEDVRIVNIGDTIGAWIVRSVDQDSVELVDPVTGASFRIR